MKHVLFTALNWINKLQEIVEDSVENNARFKRGNCNKTFFKLNPSENPNERRKVEFS